MTKKDYIKLAEVIKRHNKGDKLHKFIVDLCNMLYMDNYAFGTKKFIDYINK